jgi:crotonobetainyl-CoA:carnitine CoA-transferase CaiB-like acyl-CoA transferase
VVDLSAMWAGPLCARILGAAGMEVVKVEDVRRPDAARDGDPALYDWLHSGHEVVVVDLHSRDGVYAVRELLARADVVIEGSRPRALAQLGIDAGATIAAARGQTWVSITGYGRSGDASNAVAFGDDAAVAGGLVAPDAAGEPVFAADALADPMTGLFAALGALVSQSCGGGHLVDVAMAAVSRAVARAGPERAPHVVTRCDGTWTVRCEGAFADDSATVAAPHALGTC